MDALSARMRPRWTNAARGGQGRARAAVAPDGALAHSRRTSMKIALVQFTPRLGDVAANLARIEREAADAAGAGAHLVVFPELALTGYRLRDLVPAVAVRLDADGPVRDRLLAVSRRVPLLLGLAEESADHRFYNSAVYLDDGAVQHVHRKCYLPTYGMFDEAMDFAPGERLAAFDTRVGRAGVLVCEDVWHPAAATVLAQDGATLLFVLSASPLRGLGVGSDPGVLSADAVRELVRSLSRFNTLPAFYCNRSGFEDGLGFAGGSFATGASGELLGTAPPLEEARLSIDLDPAQTRVARAAYPLVRDERIHLLARELLRIAGERARPPMGDNRLHGRESAQGRTGEEE